MSQRRRKWEMSMWAVCSGPVDLLTPCSSLCFEGGRCPDGQVVKQNPLPARALGARKKKALVINQTPKRVRAHFVNQSMQFFKYSSHLFLLHYTLILSKVKYGVGRAWAPGTAAPLNGSCPRGGALQWSVLRRVQWTRWKGSFEVHCQFLSWR